MANKATVEELHNIRKWVKPKTKIRKVFKIEEDGTKTQAIALDMNGRAVFHNEEGPALVNKEQRRKEYYLNGIEFYQKNIIDFIYICKKYEDSQNFITNKFFKRLITNKGKFFSGPLKNIVFDYNLWITI